VRRRGRLRRGVLAALAAGIAAAPAIARAQHGAEMTETPPLLVEVAVKAVAVGIVAGVLAYCVKCFLRPGETDETHIKRRILHDRW